jgi:hypothetical protein
MHAASSKGESPQGVIPQGNIHGVDRQAMRQGTDAAPGFERTRNNDDRISSLVLAGI